MKKLLSLLLVVTLITGCLFFASCSSSKVKVKDFESDPQAALNEALQNSGNQFFSDDAKTEAVIEKALQCGSLSVAFESDSLLAGGMISKIAETLYMDSENGKVVSDTSVTVNGEDLFARIFLDKNGLAINSEALFGQKTTFLANLSTLADKIDTSALGQMIGADAETMASVKETIESVKASYEEAFAYDEEAAKEISNEIHKLLKMAVANEKGVTITEGETANCVVVTYTIDNTTVKAVADKLLAELPEDTEGLDELKAQYDELIEMMNEMADIKLTAKTYVNAKSNTVAKASLTGTVTLSESGAGEADVITVAADLIYGETEISLSVNMTDEDGEGVAADAKVTKEEADGKVTYKVTANTKTGSVEANLINLSYTYNKANGEFKLAGDVFASPESRMSAELTGKITVSDTEATYEINSLKVQDQTFTFKLTLSYKTLSEIPAVPSDAKDIMDLTEGELSGLMVDIMNGPLGMIFGASQGPDFDDLETEFNPF